MAGQNKSASHEAQGVTGEPPLEGPVSIPERFSDLPVAGRRWRSYLRSWQKYSLLAMEVEPVNDVDPP
jgi:hypothetical protein